MLSDVRPTRKLRFKPGADRTAKTIAKYSRVVSHQIVIDSGDWPFEPTFYGFDAKTAVPYEHDIDESKYVVVRGADFNTYSALLLTKGEFHEGAELRSTKYNPLGYVLVYRDSVTDVP